MIYTCYQNLDFKSQIEYTFETIYSILFSDNQYKILPYNMLQSFSITGKDIVISYGKSKPQGIFKNHIHIYESNFFGKNYLLRSSLPKLPLRRFNDIPIIYGSNIISDRVKRQSTGTHNLLETDIDIIASIFFMITRYEEVVIRERDKFDRFPATESLAYKENFLDRPIVNEYIELLWNWIDGFHSGIQRKKLWGDKEFVVALTHDIDSWLRYPKGRPPLFSIMRALSNGKFTLSFKFFSDYIRAVMHLKEDPRETSINYIINLEMNFGFRSSFYFLVEKGKFGTDYNLKSKKVRKVLSELQAHDFETGFHAGFNTYKDENLFLKEKEYLQAHIGTKLYGNRQHYLRWENPTTWRIVENAGLMYDTTLGYSKQVGFRAGICHPYKPFDLFDNKVFNFWEVPLMIMDVSLLSYKEPFKVIDSIIKEVKKHHGVCVMLWHNSSLCELYSPLLAKLYEKVMQKLLRENVTVSSLVNIIEKYMEDK